MSINDLIFTNFKLTLFETSILKTLNIFYSESKNVNLLKEILINKSSFSIRLIDYFITKYCKINKITYYIDNNLFNIFIAYKQQLKLYQKKYFDPFSRGIRIPFFFYDNTTLITTIGQLNFFKWFIEKKIYSYIINNNELIENSMNINNKEIKDNKKVIKKKIVTSIDKIIFPNKKSSTFSVSFTF